MTNDITREHFFRDLCVPKLKVKDTFISEDSQRNPPLIFLPVTCTSEHLDGCVPHRPHVLGKPALGLSKCSALFLAWHLPAQGVLIYRMPMRFAGGTWLNLFGSEMRTAETNSGERKQQGVGGRCPWDAG